MDEIRWIKIVTNVFDNRKIKMIEAMPEGDAILIVWFKILTLAGQINDGGLIYFTKDIPYTEQLLATQFNRPLSIIQLAIATFERLGMVEITNDVIMVSNWEKYQNVDGMEKVREQTRKRVKEYRDRQRFRLVQDGDPCAYCGKIADTVDHIIPRSKGGADTEDNVVPCCKNCNSSKKNKDLADFLNDSFFYKYQGIDHELVRSNPKIMKHVQWDGERYRNVTVTLSNGAEKEIEKENKNIPPNILTDIAPQKGASIPERKKIPPTLDMVRAYCKSRGNNVNPEEWMDHYDSNGWMVGRNHMKDWQAAVRTWEHDKNRTQQKPKKPPVKQENDPAFNKIFGIGGE